MPFALAQEQIDIAYLISLEYLGDWIDLRIFTLDQAWWFSEWFLQTENACAFCLHMQQLNKKKRQTSIFACVESALINSFANEIQINFAPSQNHKYSLIRGKKLADFFFSYERC